MALFLVLFGIWICFLLLPLIISRLVKFLYVYLTYFPNIIWRHIYLKQGAKIFYWEQYLDDSWMVHNGTFDKFDEQDNNFAYLKEWKGKYRVSDLRRF